MRAFGTLRRIVAAGFAAAAIAGVAFSATQGVKPSNSVSRQGRQITLRDQLRTGLKAVTKADFAFIDLVVLRVEQGVLPRKLVDGTFLWARRRVATRSTQYFNRPMVYFRPALVVRTARSASRCKAPNWPPATQIHPSGDPPRGMGILPRLGRCRGTDNPAGEHLGKDLSIR